MKRFNIIQVGAGEYLNALIKPTMARLEKEGIAKLTQVVGIERDRGTADLVRANGQKLSDLLKHISKQDSIVILGHSNEAHTPDAVDLVNNGYSVILEKPYALNLAEAREIRKLITEHPQKIALAEYYLTMKSAPMLMAAGLIRQGTFYDNEIVKEENIKRPIAELLGKPLYAITDVMEGEGSVGKLDHRGPHLVDSRIGGGMLQDLGIHALTPLIALEEIIGKLDVKCIRKTTRTRNPEYLEMVRRVHKIPDEHIGESYAELEMETSKGIPVRMAVGKYTPKDANQRRVIIVGTEGTAMLDLSALRLSTQLHDQGFTNNGYMPKGTDKYYAVIRSCIEELSGNSPFTFNTNEVSLRAQEIILRTIEMNK